MTQQTDLLDPMALLAANIGHDEDGALILADKEWLDKSIFPNIWQHNDLKFDIYAGVAENGSYYVGKDPNPDMEDTENFMVALPSQAFRFWNVDTLQLDFLYLIDKATDVLAKEITRLPTTNYIGRQFNKAQQRYNFRNAICDRVLQFLFDEMPRIAVDLLGYPFEWVAHHYQHFVITLYQTLYLLAEHKAGVEADAFLYHYDRVHRDPDGPYVPHVGHDRLSPCFPLADVFNSEACWWLFCDDTERVTIYGEDDSDVLAWFYPREMQKLQQEDEEGYWQYPFIVCWQYLSFKKKGIDKAALQQKVIYDSVLSLHHSNNFAETLLARDFVKKGFVSDCWQNVYYPLIKL